VVTGPDVAEPERGHGRRVKDVARAVVESVAPEEARYFDDLSAQFFDRPDRMLNPAAPRGEPTSYGGLAAAAEVITGIVIAGVSNALSDEIKDLINASGRRGRSLLQRRAARKLRARRDDVLNAEPDKAKAQQAADEAKRLALRIGIDVQQAEQIGVRVFIVLSEDGADE
jgi:hypothetical protein